MSEELKDKIIASLRKIGEMFTGEIAKELKISASTASKYLEILYAEGKVKRREKRPYTYWCIKE